MEYLQQIHAQHITPNVHSMFVTMIYSIYVFK